jgi:hypothetical protein
MNTGPTRPVRACDGNWMRRLSHSLTRSCSPASGTQQLRGIVAPSAVHDVIRSSGQPLASDTRSFMEPRLGRDFSDVRVHTDTAAAASAQAIDALAYTIGPQVVFAEGHYTPTTSKGRWLLAHELAHVVQEDSRPIRVDRPLALGAPHDTSERLADRAADEVAEQGRRSDAHAPRGATTESVVRRKCDAELGTSAPGCTPSQQSTVGWQLLFKAGCDDLLPGQDAEIQKLKPGYQLKIHGFASAEGDPDFMDRLSCHRANRIAELVRARRADCPVSGIFKHGASPVASPTGIKDPNPADFWRSVIIEQVEPAFQSGEQGLDPSRGITVGWALYNRALKDPTTANLDVVADRRAGLKAWLEGAPKALAPPTAQLTRTNLDDYRRFYESAERLWTAIDILLAIQRHAAAAKDTHDAWARGTGDDQGSKHHASSVPPGAKYHIDIFGEGYYPGAINIGMAERTTTTGVFGTRVPNLIYRRFSGRAKLPIADHAADLITSENGPIGMPGLADEIARVIAPGGTIILRNPPSEEAAHDAVAKATGGTVTKDFGTSARVRYLETRIVIPGP